MPCGYRDAEKGLFVTATARHKSAQGTQRKSKSFFSRSAGRTKRLFLPRKKPEIREKDRNKGNEWFRAEAQSKGKNFFGAASPQEYFVTAFGRAGRAER